MIAANHKILLYLFSTANYKMLYFICIVLAKISTLNPHFMLKVPTMENATKHLVVISVVNLTCPDPLTQGAYQLEIHVLWIRRLSPINKYLMYMQD